MSNAQVNPVDGAAKLATVIKPLLDESTKTLREYGSANSQEVLLAIEKLSAKMDVLEKLVGEKKKPVRTEKKDTPAGVPADTGADLTAQQGAQKNFANNKLVYFRDQFKNNAVYRAKYVTAEVQDLIDRDESIKLKTNEGQKLIAMATFCWSYFKINNPAVFAEIETDFHAVKKAHEEAIKPQQQTADARTPPKPVIG